jgi:hypothetical protein
MVGRFNKPVGEFWKNWHKRRAAFIARAPLFVLA